MQSADADQDERNCCAQEQSPGPPALVRYGMEWQSRHGTRVGDDTDRARSAPVNQTTKRVYFNVAGGETWDTTSALVTNGCGRWSSDTVIDGKAAPDKGPWET